MHTRLINSEILLRRCRRYRTGRLAFRIRVLPPRTESSLAPPPPRTAAGKALKNVSLPFAPLAGVAKAPTKRRADDPVPQADARPRAAAHQPRPPARLQVSPARPRAQLIISEILPRRRQQCCTETSSTQTPGPVNCAGQTTPTLRRDIVLTADPRAITAGSGPANTPAGGAAPPWQRAVLMPRGLERVVEEHMGLRPHHGGAQALLVAPADACMSFMITLGADAVSVSRCRLRKGLATAHSAVAGAAPPESGASCVTGNNLTPA